MALQVIISMPTCMNAEYNCCDTSGHKMPTCMNAEYNCCDTSGHKMPTCMNAEYNCCDTSGHKMPTCMNAEYNCCDTSGHKMPTCLNAEYNCCDTSGHKMQYDDVTVTLLSATLIYMKRRVLFWQQQNPIYSRRHDKKMRDRRRPCAVNDCTYLDKFLAKELEKVHEGKSMVFFIYCLLLPLHLIPTFMWGRCTMTYASM